MDSISGVPASALRSLARLARFPSLATLTAENAEVARRDTVSATALHPPREIIKRLIEALADPRATTRVAALVALRALARTPEASEALTPVRRETRAPEQIVRETAFETLAVLEQSLGQPSAAVLQVAARDIASSHGARVDALSEQADRDERDVAQRYPPRSIARTSLRAPLASRLPIGWVIAIVALLILLGFFR